MGIMENEIEIFVAWLIKYIKKDKRITGKDLAGMVGCDPTTISSYIRRRTKPDYDMRSTILGAVEVSYEKMMDEGRKIITTIKVPTIPKTTITAQATTTAQITDQMTEPPKRRKTDIEIQTDKNHKELVGRFINKDVAIDINQGLLALEEIEGRDVLLEIKGVVNQMLRQAEKKRGTVNPANGTEGN